MFNFKLNSKAPKEELRAALSFGQYLDKAHQTLILTTDGPRVKKALYDGIVMIEFISLHTTFLDGAEWFNAGVFETIKRRCFNRYLTMSIKLAFYRLLDKLSPATIQNCLRLNDRAATLQYPRSKFQWLPDWPTMLKICLHRALQANVIMQQRKKPATFTSLCYYFNYDSKNLQAHCQSLTAGVLHSLAASGSLFPYLQTVGVQDQADRLCYLQWQLLDEHDSETQAHRKNLDHVAMIEVFARQQHEYDDWLSSMRDGNGVVDQQMIVENWRYLGEQLREIRRKKSFVDLPDETVAYRSSLARGWHNHTF